ncbi:hypothetical protein OU798_19130 [Prolixibacteraceae bacterium Z1-6]|uniref:Uncharacterized protein n=1 Tax=Draconibacterium aestuarii TaxID=2998507 RepID=A0A9X3FC34_9BACT|nr:hypothetical protein [Prolixibacteraceae bacterium Z1-6]
MKGYLSVLALLILLMGCSEIDQNNCTIEDLVVSMEECISDSTFLIKIDHVNENTEINSITVFNGDNPLAEFSLDDLPREIEVIRESEKDSSSYSICVTEHPNCCKKFKFQTPDCSDMACAIGELTLDPGECTGDNTYNLYLNFAYENAGNEFINVLGREDKLIGTYKLADLPLTIENFEASGNDYDFIKVCINDQPDCCKVAEFLAPVCAAECAITELLVDRGECTGNNTYNLHLNFAFENAGNEFFNVFGREDKLIGTYKLADLPLTIENFEASGNDYDFIKVCINDQPDCCKVAEFLAPVCAAECAITELLVDRGECVNDSTYRITLNFSYTNPGNDLFEVFGRDDKYYGYFNLSDLPVTINEFRKSGNEFDLMKVCINDTENCCKLKEIESPDCGN